MTTDPTKTTPIPMNRNVEKFKNMLKRAQPTSASKSPVASSSTLGSSSTTTTTISTPKPMSVSTNTNTTPVAATNVPSATSVPVNTNNTPNIIQLNMPKSDTNSNLVNKSTPTPTFSHHGSKMPPLDRPLESLDSGYHTIVNTSSDSNSTNTSSPSLLSSLPSSTLARTSLLNLKPINPKSGVLSLHNTKTTNDIPNNQIKDHNKPTETPSTNQQPTTEHSTKPGSDFNINKTTPDTTHNSRSSSIRPNLIPTVTHHKTVTESKNDDKTTPLQSVTGKQKENLASAHQETTTANVAQSDNVTKTTSDSTSLPPTPFKPSSSRLQSKTTNKPKQNEGDDDDVVVVAENKTRDGKTKGNDTIVLYDASVSDNPDKPKKEENNSALKDANSITKASTKTKDTTEVTTKAQSTPSNSGAQQTPSSSSVSKPSSVAKDELQDPISLIQRDTLDMITKFVNDKQLQKHYEILSCTADFFGDVDSTIRHLTDFVTKVKSDKKYLKEAHTRFGLDKTDILQIEHFVGYLESDEKSITPMIRKEQLKRTNEQIDQVQKNSKVTITRESIFESQAMFEDVIKNSGYAIGFVPTFDEIEQFYAQLGQYEFEEGSDNLYPLFEIPIDIFVKAYMAVKNQAYILVRILYDSTDISNPSNITSPQLLYTEFISNQSNVELIFDLICRIRACEDMVSHYIMIMIYILKSIKEGKFEATTKIKNLRRRESVDYGGMELNDKDKKKGVIESDDEGEEDDTNIEKRGNDKKKTESTKKTTKTDETSEDLMDVDTADEPKKKKKTKTKNNTSSKNTNKSASSSSKKKDESYDSDFVESEDEVSKGEENDVYIPKGEEEDEEDEERNEDEADDETNAKEEDKDEEEADDEEDEDEKEKEEVDEDEKEEKEKETLNKSKDSAMAQVVDSDDEQEKNEKESNESDDDEDGDDNEEGDDDDDEENDEKNEEESADDEDNEEDDEEQQ